MVGFDDEGDLLEALLAGDADAVLHQEFADSVATEGGDDGHRIEVVFVRIGFGLGGRYVVAVHFEEAEGDLSGALVDGAWI